MMNGPNILPQRFADMSMHMLSPKRHVGVDMVMVQLISAILIFAGILVFKNTEISQVEMSLYMFGINRGIFYDVTHPNHNMMGNY